jgi:hypothetical protein
MNVLFIITGIGFLGYGFYTIIDDKHNERMREIWRRNETGLDRKVFPGKQGEFISRYLAGARFVALGVLLLVFAFIDTFSR